MKFNTIDEIKEAFSLVDSESRVSMIGISVTERRLEQFRNLRSYLLEKNITISKIMTPHVYTILDSIQEIKDKELFGMSSTGL